MVADLTELHDEVHERAGGVRVAQVGGLLQEILDGYVRQERLVKTTLPRAEFYVDILLDLFRRVLATNPCCLYQGAHLFAEFVLDMALHTTQHERLQDHMKTAQLVLVEFAPLVLGSILDILREPLVELVVRVEQSRHDEMEESPQLCKRRKKPPRAT